MVRACSFCTWLWRLQANAFEPVIGRPSKKYVTKIPWDNGINPVKLSIDHFSFPDHFESVANLIMTISVKAGGMVLAANFVSGSTV